MDRPPSTFRPESLLAHREWAERAARALVFGDAEAEDIQQQAWLEVLEHPPEREPASLRGWFRTVLKFTAIDASRRARTRRVHESAASRPERLDASPAELVARAETLDRVAHAVLELDEPYRATVLLRYFEGLEACSIADIQGIPVETVRTRLKRAVAQLRERLDAENRGDRRRWCLALLPLLRSPEATAAGAGSASGSSAIVAALGGVIMAKKATSAAVAVAVLLLFGGLLAVNTFHDGQPPPRSEAAEAASSSGEASPPQSPRPHPEASPSPEPSITVTPPSPPPSGRRLRGKVLDALDHPVPQAKILTGAFMTPGDDPVREVLAVTDGAGEFSILVNKPLGAMWAEAPGHASSPVASVPPAGAREEMVVLRLRAEGGRIEGVVRDASSQPVVGASVRLRPPTSLYPAAPPGGAGGADLYAAPVRTDSDGRFVLADLSAGPRGVLVEHTGFAPVVEQATVIAGQSVTLDFQLSPGATVYGTLLTSEGAPARAVRVVLVGMARMRDRETQTDATGQYRFEFVPEGGALVRATDGAGSSFEGTASVRSGDRFRLDGQLHGARTTSGRLADGQGHPLRGWTVSVYVRTGEKLTPLNATRSNDSGDFEIKNLPPGDLVVGASPATNAIPWVIGLPQGETITINTDSATGTVTGSVMVDENTGPLRFQALRSDDPTRTWNSTTIRAADGRFRIDLPAGEYLARITTTGGGMVELPRTTILAGTTTDVGVVDLTRIFPVTMNIDPLWSDRGTYTLYRLGDDDARALLLFGNLQQEIKAKLSDGRYVLHAEGSDIRPLDMHFTISGAAATIDVPISRSPGVAFLRFTIVGREGESYWLSIRDQDGALVFDGLVKVNPDGWAGAGMNVGPGRYTYRLSAWRVFEGEAALEGFPPTGEVIIK